MKRVFIDGKSGTTGLNIYERLNERADIEIINLSPADRRDENARRKALNEADIAFLCLPDEAAIQAVSFVKNSDTVIIDTSTAHRTAVGWVYGFPEIHVDGEEQIRCSKRISVPGCHASGFIALISPLRENGILSDDALLSCFSVTGYSGGGKNMIAEYEATDKDELLCAPRQYALTQQHKHLKEMKAVCKLNSFPIFSPIVADFYSGMEVTVPLFSSMLCKGKGVEDITDVYRELYCGDMVKYVDNNDENGFMSAAAFSGKDSMEISVKGNEERILLTARYDNLGKGACAAAIECINIILGADKRTGLVL